MTSDRRCHLQLLVPTRRSLCLPSLQPRQHRRGLKGRTSANFAIKQFGRLTAADAARHAEHVFHTATYVHRPP